MTNFRFVDADRCVECGKGDRTHGNYSERRMVDVPNGWVHFGCLGDWLVHDAMDRWFGRLGRAEREALRARLGLPPGGQLDLLTLKSAARTVRRTGQWLSTQVQGPAMSRFASRVRTAGQVAERRHADAQRDEQLRDLVSEMATVLGPAATASKPR